MSAAETADAQELAKARMRAEEFLKFCREQNWEAASKIVVVKTYSSTTEKGSNGPKLLWVVFDEVGRPQDLKKKVLEKLQMVYKTVKPGALLPGGSLIANSEPRSIRLTYHHDDIDGMTMTNIKGQWFRQLEIY